MFVKKIIMKRGNKCRYYLSLGIFIENIIAGVVFLGFIAPYLHDGNYMTLIGALWFLICACAYYYITKRYTDWWKEIDKR